MGHCQACPANTYWRMLLEEEELVGVKCEQCPPWNISPEGSKDYTKCVCEDERCEPVATKKTNVPIIVGVLSVFIVVAGVIAALFWCKTYGSEFAKQISGKDFKELVSTEEDDSLLQDGVPNPLLNIDIPINITEAELDDGYNDVTKKGDINDMEAVLRAAVISEKRRSRVISMSSMTDLTERYRTTSFNSQMSIPEKSGYYPSHHDGSRLPLPGYEEFAKRTAQTQL